jgi:hypothetical protein
MAAGTRDLTKKGAAAVSIGTPYKISKDLDFADIAAAKGAAIEANEIAQLIDIPAGTLVTGVVVEILRAAAGTTYTAQVGDGDNALGYIGTSDLKAAVGTLYGPASTLAEAAPNVASPAFFAGKAYGAADTLDVKVIGYNTVTVQPKIRVTAICQQIKN